MDVYGLPEEWKTLAAMLRPELVQAIPAGQLHIYGNAGDAQGALSQHLPPFYPGNSVMYGAYDRKNRKAIASMNNALDGEHGKYYTILHEIGHSFDPHGLGGEDFAHQFALEQLRGMK